MLNFQIRLVVLFLLFIAIACGGGGEKKPTRPNKKSKEERLAEKFGITLFELENGVGPIKEKIKLDPINPDLVTKGSKVFEIKCTQCHKIDERYTGPALKDITVKRTPEYILNMILNPEEMTKKHPEARKLLAQFANQMTFQDVNDEDARAILDYLRSIAE